MVGRMLMIGLWKYNLCSESDGFSESYECNDGIDNDEDGALIVQTFLCLTISNSHRISFLVSSVMMSKIMTKMVGLMLTWVVSFHYFEDPENYPAIEEFQVPSRMLQWYR